MTHELPVTKISIVIPVGRYNLDLSNLRESLNLNLSHSEVEFIIVEDSEKPGSNPSLKALAGVEILTIQDQPETLEKRNVQANGFCIGIVMILAMLVHSLKKSLTPMQMF
jgi:hypothetical protein